MGRHSVVLGLALALVTGCQSNGTGPYPVRGTLLLENGQPATELAGGLVTFSSAEMKKSSIGTIRPDGTFELSTVSQGDGAIPGTYEVSVSGPTNEERSELKTKKAPQTPHYVCVPANVTVEPKTNDVKLTLRDATRRPRE
jgi:hypothetical protein